MPASLPTWRADCIIRVPPGVVYDFCTGRGSQFPYAFLNGWSGTLVCDGYAGYDKALLLEYRCAAG